jgi:hypothetical protein
VVTRLNTNHTPSTWRQFAAAALAAGALTVGALALTAPVVTAPVPWWCRRRLALTTSPNVGCPLVPAKALVIRSASVAIHS